MMFLHFFFFTFVRLDLTYVCCLLIKLIGNTCSTLGWDEMILFKLIKTICNSFWMFPFHANRKYCKEITVSNFKPNSDRIHEKNPTCMNDHLQINPWFWMHEDKKETTTWKSKEKCLYLKCSLFLPLNCLKTQIVWQIFIFNLVAVPYHTSTHHSYQKKKQNQKCEEANTRNKTKTIIKIKITLLFTVARFLCFFLFGLQLEQTHFSPSCVHLNW